MAKKKENNKYIKLAEYCIYMVMGLVVINIFGKIGISINYIIYFGIACYGAAAWYISRKQIKSKVEEIKKTLKGDDEDDNKVTLRDEDT